MEKRFLPSCIGRKGRETLCLTVRRRNFQIHGDDLLDTKMVQRSLGRLRLGATEVREGGERNLGGFGCDPLKEG